MYQGEDGAASRSLPQRDRQERVEYRAAPPFRADEAPAEHDALARDELGQLAVEAADLRPRRVGMPDPVVAADPLVDLGPGEGVAARRHPPDQQSGVEPGPV